MHRQAEHLFGEAIADRHSALGERKVPISRLAMERLGVIDRGWNALGLQRGGKRVALTRLEADRILRPDWGGFIAGARDDRDVGEAGRVALGHAITGFDLLRKYFELFDKHRCLDGVQPAGDPDTRGLRSVDALAVKPDAFDARGERVVVGENSAAIAVATERLGREETGIAS